MAQQIDTFIGEIKIFAGHFAPRGWAYCHGKLLSVNQHEPLFSLIGTKYGGDGMSTFGLPDLRGRIPIHQGRGPGLSFYQIGQMGGHEKVTLTVNQIPNHNHPMTATSTNGNKNDIANSLPAIAGAEIYVDPDATRIQAYEPTAISSYGGGQAHSNIQPRIAVNFIIALEGAYPSRN